jgi:hypothetical protein
MVMTERRFLHAFHIVLIIVIVCVGFGSAVWQLWNWLVPGLFGLPRINYWQALGLLALSRLLFGGWGFFGRPGSPRHRMGALTPEERERIRHGLRGKCA